MKKTLIAIIAVILVVVMSLTLFACNNGGKNNDPANPGTQPGGNTDKPGGNTDKPATNTGKELSADELKNSDYAALTEQLRIYADQYLTNNATDKKDVSKALASTLNDLVADIDGEPIKSISVKLESDDCYSIKFTYKNNDTYTYHEEGELQARVAETGVYAGYEKVQKSKDSNFFDTTLATVYNAALHTIRQAIADATEFGEAYQAVATGTATSGIPFGGSVEAAFTVNYGVGEGQIGPMSYGLKVYGTLGYTAEETEVAIEVIDESKDTVLGGLYYKDATLYLDLNIGDYQQKLYLDNADINAIVGGFFGMADYEAPACYDVLSGEYYDAHDFVNGYCTQCGAVEPQEEEQQEETEPFYAKTDSKGEYVEYTSIKTAITELTGKQLVGTIVGIVGGMFDCGSVKVGANTRYQYSLDLDAKLQMLLNNPTIGPMVSQAVNPILGSIEFLSELDLGSFKGIGGVLTLSFDVSGSGVNSRLAGVQISYNAAQKDFRWNGDDDVAKVYGPINGAITISDFYIGEVPVEINGEKDEEYTYFSPLNAEATAQVTLSGYSDDAFNDTYDVTVRSAFNPFAMEDGSAEIVIEKGKDAEEFLHIYFHNVEDTWTVTTYYDGLYYETAASDSDLFNNLLEDYIKPLGDRDSDSVISDISAYVWALVDQFSKVYTYADLEADVDKAKASINALTVTEKDADGNVLPSSKWLDGIKTNALREIEGLFADIDTESEEEVLREAKSSIDIIVSGAKEQYSEQLALEGKTDSLMEGFDIMALVSNVGKLKDLFIGDNGAANPEVFDYKLDFSDLQLYANLDYKVYNSVIAVLKTALPKLQEFDATAAKVKVDMNYTAANKGKLVVNVEYEGYTIDVVVDVADCFDDNGLKASCTMTADVSIKTPDTNYVYAASIVCNNWNKNNGTITISFKESDGKNVRSAIDEYVNIVVTQSWDGEEYLGFDADVTLAAKNAAGELETYEYAVSAKHDGNMYNLTVDGITLGMSSVTAGLDEDNTLSFGIPAPYCSVTCRIAMGDEDVTIAINQAKLTKWGSRVDVEGITIEPGDAVIRNDESGKALDEAWFEIITEVLNKFFYTTTEAEQI